MLGIATAARAAPPSAPPPRAADLLLDGLAVLISDGARGRNADPAQCATCVPSHEIGTEEGLRWLWLAAGRAAGFIWDYEAWDSLTMPDPSCVTSAHSRTSHSPSARCGGPHLRRRAEGGRVTGPEADTLAEATDGRIVPHTGLSRWAAFRGREG
jgi:hypothetical protein